jgi:hypothetical protein
MIFYPKITDSPIYKIRPKNGTILFLLGYSILAACHSRLKFRQKKDRRPDQGNGLFWQRRHQGIAA